MERRLKTDWLSVASTVAPALAIAFVSGHAMHDHPWRAFGGLFLATVAALLAVARGQR